jgi:hypothetical protein
LDIYSGCEDVVCPDINHRVTKDGYCEYCPEYYKVASDKRNCIPVGACTGQRQVLQPNGECIQCKPYDEFYDTEQNVPYGACVPTFCSYRQKKLFDGRCQDCPAYTRVSEDGRECLPIVCSDPRDIVNINNVCERCIDYFRPNALQRECI